MPKKSVYAWSGHFCWSHMRHRSINRKYRRVKSRGIEEEKFYFKKKINKKNYITQNLNMQGH